MKAIVVIGSEIYGGTIAVVHDATPLGVVVAMCYTPPLGTVVTIHFENTRADETVDELVARAEAVHHGYVGETRMVTLRFLEFVEIVSVAAKIGAPH